MYKYCKHCCILLVLSPTSLRLHFEHSKLFTVQQSTAQRTDVLIPRKPAIECLSRLSMSHRSSELTAAKKLGLMSVWTSNLSPLYLALLSPHPASHVPFWAPHFGTDIEVLEQAQEKAMDLVKVYEEQLREMERRRPGVTLSLSTATWKEAAGSWSLLPSNQQQEQEKMASSSARGGSGETSGAISLWKRFLNIATGCLRQWWSRHPWKVLQQWLNVALSALVLLTWCSVIG